MPDRGMYAECDNCGVRGNYTLVGEKKATPQGWVTLSGTSVGLAFFHEVACRDNWTSSREWRSTDEAIAELKKQVIAYDPAFDTAKERKPRTAKARYSARPSR